MYAQLIHNAGASSWERADPLIPATGLPMISGGQGLGFEEAEVMSAVDKAELSGAWGWVGRRHGPARGAAETGREAGE
mgnify:CR=1 FL=1